jgi:GNAT superfamily N-acetyltransferase
MKRCTSSKVLPRKKSPIRGSSQQDVDQIHFWLQREKAEGVHDNFLCNWELTLRAHREHRLIVYVDAASNTAVGYQWGGLLRPGILEVRRDMRRRGIGHALVNHRVAQALRRDEGLLYIQCKPESSIPFWRRVGFTLLDESNEDDGKQYAYRILEKKHELPPGGTPVHATVRFYPEEVKWKPSTAPLSSVSPPARMYADGFVRLSQRAYGFASLHRQSRDLVAEILVEGTVRYRDKAKYEEASRVGVCRCTNGYFIDRISAWPDT